MAPLPIEVLLGVYLGVLTGIIPAVVSWTLGFTFKYFTGVTIPGLGVVVLSLAIAGTNGGLLALNDPTVRGAPNSVMLTVAIIVVLMMSLYAHAKGDTLGAEFPRRLSLRSIRQRTLSADVIERVEGRGQVRVRPIGEVDDLEGYPPLPPDIRDEIREGEWTFPADLPLSEIESRLAATLRTEFELADATVDVDEEARATIAAAPPTSGVSRRVPSGERAVSLDALVPTGLAVGDEVSLLLADRTIDGTVVSARSDRPSSPAPPAATDGGAEEPAPTTSAAPVADGGDGRITVSTAREHAEELLDADRVHVVVRPRGRGREFELLALLRRAGRRFRKVTVAGDSDLAGRTIGDTSIRDAHGIVVLAVRRPDGWTLAPRGSTVLAGGDELFVVGTTGDLDAFAEVAA